MHSQSSKIYMNVLQSILVLTEFLIYQENVREKGIQLEKLTPDLLSLCNLVSSLPVPTAKHRLVRTEIAQKAAYILKNVIGLQVKNNILSCSSNPDPFFR